MLQVGIEPFGSNRNASHNLSPTLRASATRTTRPPSKQFFRKVPPSWEKVRWNELRDKMEIARQCSVLKPAIAIYAAFIAIGGSPFRCFASFQPESIWRLKCQVLRTPTPPTHTETDKMKKNEWGLGTGIPCRTFSPHKREDKSPGRTSINKIHYSPPTGKFGIVWRPQLVRESQDLLKDRSLSHANVLFSSSNKIFSNLAS